VTVFPADAPAGRLSLVAPSKTTPTSLRFLGLTHSNNTTTGLKRATAAKDADMLLVPDGTGNLKRYHFDGTNWRSGLRTVADPTSVNIPAGGAFFVRRAAGSNFTQWRPPSELVSDGLIFHLDASNANSYPGNGTTWTDLSGNAYTGNLTNGPTFNSSLGGGVVFDGVDDFVDTNFLVNSGNELSFGVWCMPTAAGQSAGSDLIGKDHSINQPWASWGIDFMPDRSFRYFVANGSTFSPIQSQPQTLNQTYHVFATYKNKVLNAYINGSLVATTTNLNDPVYDNSKKVSLGAWLSNQSNNRFIGTIYSAFIYNRALTQAEVLQNYNATKERFGIVRDGLVLHLDAGNTDSYPGNGTTWTDLTTNGNNGTLTNGTTFDSANGGSILFDGTNDYVNLGSNSSYNLSNNFTLSCWVNPSQLGHGNGDELCSLATGSPAPYISYGLEWMDTGRFRFSIGNTSNQFLNYLSNSTYSLNNWYNVVGTYDGSTIRLYVNNVLQNSTSVSTTVTYSANQMTVGTWFYDISPSNALTGRISHVKIYNRALTASEIQQNFNATRGRYGL
jgi:hypothetical protein